MVGSLGLILLVSGLVGLVLGILLNLRKSRIKRALPPTPLKEMRQSSLQSTSALRASSPRKPSLLDDDDLLIAFDEAYSSVKRPAFDLFDSGVSNSTFSSYSDSSSSSSSCSNSSSSSD